jgi:hypothetical protein
MNIELIIRYLLFLLETRDLQWALVRVREAGGRPYARRQHSKR